MTEQVTKNPFRFVGEGKGDFALPKIALPARVVAEDCTVRLVDWTIQYTKYLITDSVHSSRIAAAKASGFMLHV